MRLRATLERPTGVLEDLHISADPGATVHDVARSIVGDDPRGDYGGRAYDGGLTLEVRATDGSHAVETFDGRDTLDDLGLADGVLLRVVPEGDAPRVAVGVLQVIAGPDEGVHLTLYRGTSTVGRADSCDVVLDDDMVSKLHARIHATADRVEIVDLNSANGVLLGDALVPRADITDGTSVTLGATTLVARLAPDAEPVSPSLLTRVHTRAPRVEARFPTRELEGAALPVPQEKQPFPWLMVAMPAVVGLVVYSVTRSPLSLIFVAMSPAMMLGNFMTGASRRKRQLKEAIATFERQLDRLRERLRVARDEEAVARHAEAPSLEDINTSASAGTDLLWTRRPEHWSFMFARLGVGTAPSRVTVKEPEGRDRALPEYEERFDALVDGYREIPDVPIVEDLAQAGALGIVGGRGVTAAYARGLVAQLAGLHAPSELVITGIMGAGWADDLAALKWLPHAEAAQSLLGVPLGASPQGAIDVVSRLEELAAVRSGGKDAPVPLGAIAAEDAALRVGAGIGERGTDASGSRAPQPAVLVLIADDAPLERARLIQLMERAAGRGIHPVWLSRTRAALPAACRTFVEFDDAAMAAAHFVRVGATVAPMVVEGFSAAHLSRFALALARTADAGAAAADASDIPRTVPMLDLVGADLALEADAVLDRWRQNGSLVSAGGAEVAPHGYQPRLRALVGQAAAGALHIDLRTEGPHALVGGTTGSGKSEFLQAWVLGMAAEYSPQRVTFLFVDYKGGSAFADCTQLPHCVGLVTDLSPHLVRRALVSLRAELHFREELLNRKRAKDIIALEKRGDPECPPALILVIDEFAALATEVPDFVDGVVDIAQRGRSLGIHLIMATQRPAGVIKDNLRANTNLRVALRMADEADSRDVIGDVQAAQFSPEIPGRAALKSGPGRLTRFQSAFAGGRTATQDRELHPEISSFGFGGLTPWERPRAAAGTDQAVGPTDQQRLVSTFVAGARSARLAAPRRPWLDELPTAIALEDIVGGSDARLPFGVVDVPQRQQQQPLSFEPEADQNMIVFGASGAGKTTVLRTLATAAGHVTEGAVHVYGLDAGGSALRMLEVLPHVGSVVSGDDPERVMRLMRMLRATVEERAVRFGAANASTLSEYRQLEARSQEPRIVMLLDNFPTFRAEYEGVPGRGEAYAALQAVMQEGRAVGVHVVLTADRAASISNSLQATVQKRVVMRLADQDGYSPLGAPRDVLDAESPAGRGIVNRLECQVAVPHALTNARELSEALARDAARMPAAIRPAAEPVGSLPAEYRREEMPSEVDGQPVLGLSDVELAPHPFDPAGALIVAGGPSSGRTTALYSLAQAVRQWRADAVLVALGARRDAVTGWDGWDLAGTDAESLGDLSALVDAASESGRPLALFVEAVTDFADTPTEKVITTMLKRARTGDLLVVVESDVVDLSGFGALKSEVKLARRGVVLQPETGDGDAILKTAFPRVSRAEFGPGRGLWAASGRVARVQIPLPLALDDPAGLPPAGAVLPRAEGAEPAANPATASAAAPATPALPAVPSVPSWAIAPGRE
ncbi:FtsK/SpoIIIE domain-containing protein [Demequina sp. NBRC 110057]|uniref:FtsK/SpoIIIE domain-containing protein n=1 Tax=Demequina sp. NBRC 110057 TaxID=1570346 RepID=UPI000A048C96|nr:FtsK/SpoIIIE domain-containing protein [Demequina sp. NBRC 110057]